MSKKPDRYADFVEHPKYGRSPQFTSVVPTVSKDEKFVLQARSGHYGRIERTAVIADMEKQPKGASYFIKYYFDESKQCTDCNREFIFFAQEQKYWFDELGFSLATKAKRCYECRQVHNALKRNNTRYAELKHIENRTIDETMEMADICLTQLEAGLFNPRQAQTVRALIKNLNNQTDGKSADLAKFIEQIQCRLFSFEDDVTRRTK